MNSFKGWSCLPRVSTRQSTKEKTTCVGHTNSVWKLINAELGKNPSTSLTYAEHIYSNGSRWTFYNRLFLQVWIMNNIAVTHVRKCCTPFFPFSYKTVVFFGASLLIFSSLYSDVRFGQMICPYSEQSHYNGIFNERPSSIFHTLLGRQSCSHSRGDFPERMAVAEWCKQHISRPTT